MAGGAGVKGLPGLWDLPWRMEIISFGNPEKRIPTSLKPKTLLKTEFRPKIRFFAKHTIMCISMCNM